MQREILETTHPSGTASFRCEGTWNGKAPDSVRYLVKNCSSIIEIANTRGSHTLNPETQAFTAGHTGDQNAVALHWRAAREPGRHSAGGGDPDFITDKNGETWQAGTFWGIWGACRTVWNLLWDGRKGPWDYVKLERDTHTYSYKIKFWGKFSVIT